MEASMIPDNVPTILVQVKNGKGGPNKDSIPVYDKVAPGIHLGFLKNDTLIRIVDPAYPGIAKYRKTWNKTTWVEFNSKLNDRCFCEESGHLFPFVPEQGEGETETYQVVSDVFQDGKRTIQLLKLKS
jgi:hypothetical protein